MHLITINKIPLFTINSVFVRQTQHVFTRCGQEQVQLGRVFCKQFCVVSALYDVFAVFLRTF